MDIGPFTPPSPWIIKSNGAINYPFGSTIVGNPTGGDTGLGSINAEAIYVDGVPINNLSFLTEALTVTALNTLSALSHTPRPASGIMLLIINNQTFTEFASDFSVSGTTITWLNTIYSLLPGMSVVAAYSY